MFLDKNLKLNEDLRIFVAVRNFMHLFFEENATKKIPISF